MGRYWGIYITALVFLLMEVLGYVIGGNFFSRSEQSRGHRKASWYLRKENAVIKKKIESLKPKGVYILIDTANNALHLKRGETTLLTATISAGSGNILIDPTQKRQWIFETPRGVFFIQSKFANPSWVKPDWAFVEEGKPIPKSLSERVEEGVLGEYAMGFGNGYFIHGTLYRRLLGKNVTHGCIRLGDQDLRTVYHCVPIGAKLFIF